MGPSRCYDWLHTIPLIFIFIQTNLHPSPLKTVLSPIYPIENQFSLLIQLASPLLLCLSEESMRKPAFVTTRKFFYCYFVNFYWRGEDEETPCWFSASSLLWKMCVKLPIPTSFWSQSIEDQLIVSPSLPQMEKWLGCCFSGRILTTKENPLVSSGRGVFIDRRKSPRQQICWLIPRLNEYIEK